MRNRMRYPSLAAWMGLVWATIVPAFVFAQTSNGLAPDATGNTIYIYDGMGRVTTTFYENSKGQIYSYDNAGNMLSTYSGNVSIASFDPSSTSVLVTEPAGVGKSKYVTLTVQRQGASVLSTVKYQTVDGSAIGGVNYAISSGFLTFQPGQFSNTIQIGLKYHAGYDGPVTFSVQLVPVSADTATVADSAQITINDYDPPPVFTLSGPMSAGQGTSPTYTVTRANQVNFPQTINYATADVTAVAGLSYVATSGTLTFAPTDTSQTFSVDTIPLIGYLGPVKFSTSISNPSVGGSMATSTVLTNIPDSHTPFAITLGGNSYGFPGQCQVIAVAADHPPAFPVVLNYAITFGDSNAYPYPSVGAVTDGIEISTTYFQSGVGNVSIGTGTVSLPAGASNINVPVVPSNLGCPSGGFFVGSMIPVHPGVENYVLTLTFAAPYSSMSQKIFYPAVQYQPDPLAPTLSPHGDLSTGWIGTYTVTKSSGKSFTLSVTAPPTQGSQTWSTYNFMQDGGPSLCNSSSKSCTVPQSTVGQGMTVRVKACGSSGCSTLSSPTNLVVDDDSGGGN